MSHGAAPEDVEVLELEVAGSSEPRQRLDRVTQRPLQQGEGEVCAQAGVVGDARSFDMDVREPGATDVEGRWEPPPPFGLPVVEDCGAQSPVCRPVDGCQQGHGHRVPEICELRPCLSTASR